MLACSGGIHPFGGAPAVSGAPSWPGADVFRDIVLLPDEKSGYVLDGAGGLHTFGGAPSLDNPKQQSTDHCVAIGAIGVGEIRGAIARRSRENGLSGKATCVRKNLGLGLQQRRQCLRLLGELFRVDLLQLR